MNHNVYIVINANDIVENMIDESTGNHDTLVFSLDKSKAILEFTCAFPNTMAGHKKYTLKEIKQYLKDNTLDWTEVDILFSLN